MIKPLAPSTIHCILDRHGLVKPRKRRRHKVQGKEISDTRVPNGLWFADHKGGFLLGNPRYRYPLTTVDYRSRYLKEFGLPNAIRTDNGIPFSCAGGKERHRERHKEELEMLSVVRAGVRYRFHSSPQWACPPGPSP